MWLHKVGANGVIPWRCERQSHVRSVFSGRSGRDAVSPPDKMHTYTRPVCLPASAPSVPMRKIEAAKKNKHKAQRQTHRPCSKTMLCDESSFTIPADNCPLAPLPMMPSALLSLLLLQQHQQQQQAIMTHMSSLLPTLQSSLLLPQPSQQHHQPPSPPSKYCVITDPSSPTTSSTTPPAFESLISASELSHTPQPHQPTIKPRRRRPLRGLQALAAQYDPDQLEHVLDADQLKKLRKAERKKTREMNRKLICFNCGATQSPIWRRTEDKMHSICNSCGLYYKNHKCHKPVPKVARSDSEELSTIATNSPLNDASQFKTESVLQPGAEVDVLSAYVNVDRFDDSMASLDEATLSPDSLIISHTRSGSELSFDIEQFWGMEGSSDVNATWQLASLSFDGF